MHCDAAPNPLAMFVIHVRARSLVFRSTNTFHIVLEADYSGALSMLLRYPSPQPHLPQSFVHDALYLEQNPTADRGSLLISKYSGREPEFSKRQGRSNMQHARKAHLWDDFKRRSESSPPVALPTRNSPKSLEALFQDVSQGIQRRTEAWGVAKAVRGAVTEARKNMQTMHYEPGPRVAAPKPRPSPSVTKAPTATELGLETRINILEERNLALASALGDALADLRAQLGTAKETSDDAVKRALARAESVQSCLKDPSLSLPVVTTPQIPTADSETAEPTAPPPPAISTAPNIPADQAQQNQQATSQHHADVTGPSIESGTSGPVSVATSHVKADGHADGGRDGLRSNVRPSLADAGFSWMLEGSRNHLSTFVSSASVPPEQTRHQEPPRQKGSPLFGTGGEDKKPGTSAEYDELAMRSLRGSRGPL